MQKIFEDRTFHKLLEKVDEDLAAKADRRACEHCGGKLHRGDFERKPRGGPAWDKRHSFCCSREGCRKRMTPPSVRFLGRKVYVGIVVVLVSAMMHGASAERVRELREVLGIDRRTLSHWRKWWTETFVGGGFWKAARGRLSKPVREDQMPLGLVDGFCATRPEGLLRLMNFLSPITTDSRKEATAM